MRPPINLLRITVLTACAIWLITPTSTVHAQLQNCDKFLAACNENPKPFVWAATVDSIVAKLARCLQTLEQIQPGCSAPKRHKRLST